MGKSKTQDYHSKADICLIDTLDVAPDTNGNFFMNCCGSPDSIKHKFNACGFKSLDDLAREKEAWLRTASPPEIDGLKRECGKYRLDKAETWIQAFEEQYPAKKYPRFSVTPDERAENKQKLLLLKQRKDAAFEKEINRLGKKAKAKAQYQAKKLLPKVKKEKKPLPTASSKTRTLRSGRGPGKVVAGL